VSNADPGVNCPPPGGIVELNYQQLKDKTKYPFQGSRFFLISASLPPYN